LLICVYQPRGLQERNINAILEQGMSTDSCTCGELRKAARAVTLLYDNAFKSSGLLSTQLDLLYVIYKSDSIRISHLAKELGMDRTTLTRNLSVLERQGFIKISSGKDNRTRIVTITYKGRSTVAKTIPLWNEVQLKVKQRMGEASWKELMGNLSQFVMVANQLNESK
jgi:DNA-binding MarR family transcriptional regulator